MSDLRERFEAIPDVRKKLRWHIWFSGNENKYDSYRYEEEEDTNWLNGAWFIFQELNK